MMALHRAVSGVGNNVHNAVPGMWILICLFISNSKQIHHPSPQILLFRPDSLSR